MAEIMQIRSGRVNPTRTLFLVGTVLLGLVIALMAQAADKYQSVERHYSTAPPAPATQSEADVQAKSAGCLSCHTDTDAKNMHVSQSVKLGCTDCHGGSPEVMFSGEVGAGKGEAGEAIADLSNPAYHSAMQQAHVLPRYPQAWPSSRNPQRTYTLLNKESPEFTRFINPSDLRVADRACGACHQDIVAASTRSMHSTGAMLWGGASYNNGILPYRITSWVSPTTGKA